MTTPTPPERDDEYQYIDLWNDPKYAAVRQAAREAEVGLPRHSRRVAVVRALPSPALVAAIVPGVVGALTARTWLLLLSLGALVYLLVWTNLVDQLDPECETADHWLSPADRPEWLVDECAYCRDIPLRELWRGDRR